MSKSITFTLDVQTNLLPHEKSEDDVCRKVYYEFNANADHDTCVKSVHIEKLHGPADGASIVKLEIEGPSYVEIKKSLLHVLYNVPADEEVPYNWPDISVNSEAELEESSDTQHLDRGCLVIN